MTDATERVQLYIMRGVIAELPDDERAKVDACAEQIRAVVQPYGAHGLIALALVGCQTACENAEQAPHD